MTIQGFDTSIDSFTYFSLGENQQAENQQARKPAARKPAARSNALAEPIHKRIAQK